MTLVLGCFAFLLFFLSDLNDCCIRRRPLAVCFPLGGLLLSVATVLSCHRHPSPLPLPVKGVGLVFGTVFFLLLLKALFFSMPASEAYVEQETGRAATTEGLYALCRHPGVLFFIPLYLCLSVTFGLPYRESAIYSVLNFLLIVFEDAYVFPRVLSGYDAYKKTTPFLIPRPRGIVHCIRTMKKGSSAGRKDD